MRKIATLSVMVAILLAACSGPVQRQATYPEPLPKKSSQRLVREAGKHLGEPYRYAGMSKRGWDCSGFVWTMYHRSLGIDLPRTADDMFHSGILLPLSHARAGDLVFFKIGKQRISHVGIYLRNNKFVHVSKSDGVIVSSLHDSYYRRYFVGLCRLGPELVAAAR
jgi:cell wall-associated NlpC family hydrolase